MAEVTKSEAARLAGVTRQTIHRKVKSGELSATGGKIDTSELIRVFGSINDGTVTPTLQPDAAVQTTLQARVDGLESQLAVTREQLADTSKDRDEWRDIAKEATSNVKLITDQRSTPRNNDNMMIFIGLAFLIGIDRIPPAGVPRTVCSIYNFNPYAMYNTMNNCSLQYIKSKLEERIRLQNKFSDAEHMRITPTEELASRCLNDSLIGDEWIAAKCPEAILELADMYKIELHPNELSGKPEQGADATPELQADTASIVTDPELIEDLRYLKAKKVKTIWTIGMNERPEQVKSLEQTAEEKGIDLSLLQSINITDKDIADYWDSFDP